MASPGRGGMSGGTMPCIPLATKTVGRRPLHGFQSKAPTTDHEHTARREEQGFNSFPAEWAFVIMIV